MSKKNKLTKMEKSLLEIAWRPIVIDEQVTSYSVSDTGLVRRNKNNMILTPRMTDNGYLVVKLHVNGRVVDRRLHRLVGETFIPNPENKRTINHKDGDKTNNNVSNLEWATHKENIDHSISTGLSKWARGIDTGSNIYTEEQVHEVCRLLEDGKQPAEVANIMNVSVTLPRNIKYNNKWKHISSQYNLPVAGELPRSPVGKIYPSKLYTQEQIHQVCKLLQEGYSHAEVANLAGVTVGLSSSIKGRRSWTSISKNYNIPEVNQHAREDNLRTKVVDLLDAGIVDYGEMLKILNIEDTRNNRKYLAGVKDTIRTTPPKPHRRQERGEAVKLLQCENDFGVVLNKLGLPDTRVNRQYLSAVKRSIKVSGSTTIENPNDDVETFTVNWEK